MGIYQATYRVYRCCGDVISRIIFIKEKISEAMSIYNLLPEEIFDSKSKSTHLLGWIEGLDKFKEIIEGM